MKKIIIPISALLINHSVNAQLTQGENYIQSKTYLDYHGNQPTKVAETVQYFDGLGRPKQIVNVKASPLGKDVVTHIEYDGFGRQVLDFLPVPQAGTLNGGIVPSSLANATQPDIYGSEKIFSEKEFENSPLNRILAQKQVGNAWTDKPVTFGYDAVTVGDGVRKFTTVTTWENGATKSVLGENWLYTDGQLYKNSVMDEDGNKTIEFKNGRGQLILLRKVVNNTDNADTYYVYNEYNQLAFVLPPIAGMRGDIVPNTVKHDELCYQYRYDGRNRLVEKKLPGKGWESMIYDKQDRLVGTQDAELRKKGQWLYTKYDEYGRVAITGIATGNTGTTPGSIRNAEQAIVDGYGSNNVNRLNTAFFERQGMDVYYGNPDTTYPNSSKWVTLLSLSYYDTSPSYVFNPSVSSVLGEPVLTGTETNGRSTKGLPVMSFVKNIEDDNWTKNYTYYDMRGRVVGTYSINYMDGYTKTESKLDFAGVPQTVITRHKRSVNEVERVITENFTYDHQNRLLVHKHKVDSNPEEILAQNKYNELSQLESKKVGGVSLGSALQTIDYKYNIRGWMTQINDPATLGNDLFGYKIKYNQVEGLETPNTDYTDLKVKPKFNGNIAEVDWRTSTASNDNLRRYGYVYDSLNRLTAGFYQKDSNPSAKEYFEKIDYDFNGNITNLKRSSSLWGNTSAALINNMDYNYEGNRLISVKDNVPNLKGYNGGEIKYDENGSMTENKDKEQGIIYNFLNLPSTVSVGSGRRSTSVNYIYRADGVKVRKDQILQDGTKTTDYLDGFQYAPDQNVCVLCPPPIASLQFVPTSEGYFDFAKNKYIYNYSDHLGNVRLSYMQGSAGLEIIEETNYYPFGLTHDGYNAIGGNNLYQYKYNGKERQETGMYDYGARMYMPDIGRWGVVDPLAETSRRFSPYNYTLNNPIRFIDPDGRSEQDWVKRTGQSNWEYRSDITTAQQASDAGYVGYANGRGDTNSSYTTTLSRNGVDTGVKQEVVLGEGGKYKVDGKSFIAQDNAPYVSSKEVDKLGKVLSAQAYIPAFIMSGGSGSVVMDYLTGAATRGVTDLSTQSFFKGAENVDGRQLLINTFVGGGNGFQTMGKVALTNLSLNTANNFGTSLYNGTFKQDAAINTAKIFTGGLGNAAGIVGGNTFTNTLLPSIYMNGTDKLLNNANDTYNKNH